MASGSGSNFQAIIDAVREDKIRHTVISGLIAGKPGIKAIERAKKAGIPVFILPDSSIPADLLLKQLQQWDPDLIILAGFLKKIPESVVNKYRNKIINIHPSLLPKYGGRGFYGNRVHLAVLESGDKKSGCTVHFVNEFYDEGDIIRQVQVPVIKDDTVETLSKRVLAEEHKLLPKIIAELLNSN